MDKIKNFFTRLRPEKDCDLVDRVTYYYTVILLTIFAFIIFGWSLFGTPIQCWFPPQYKGWWNEYALDYCYVQNTYFVKFHDGKVQNHWELDNQRVELPKDYEDRRQLTIGYYQWVPFVLALMAISFYLPAAFWRAMYEHSGISVRTLCAEASKSAESASASNSEKTAKHMAHYLDHSKSICERFRNRSLHGRYVVSLYLLTKLMSVVICVGQFFVLEQFLGLDSRFWGITILNDIRLGREWTETGNFPRVTQCDYKVRELGNTHHHTVQCVLIINMLNEKFFVFLWFWFGFVAILSTLSLLVWLFYALYPNSGRQYVLSYLKHTDESLPKNYKKAEVLDDFIKRTLKADGIFLLRLMAHNSGDLICCNLLGALWENYVKSRKIDDEDDLLKNGKVKLVENGDDNGKKYRDQNTVPRSSSLSHDRSKYPPLPSYDDVNTLKHRPAPPPPPPPRA
uniref:Innexin n=1 Tax=Romanomermis culicivorax TaxID=13658 RepID=A0A915III5_ROMCU